MNPIPYNISFTGHKAGTQHTYAVDCYSVTTPKGTVVQVDIYVDNSGMPRGWEATTADTTNDSGYYSSGGLVVKHDELVDFDGVSFLPKTVCAILRSRKITVSDDCLSSPL